MAEDKLNEGSEEEKKSFNDSSDDDFGLPDLEFDELQELDMSFDDDEEEDTVVSPEPVESNIPEALPGSDDIDMSVLDGIEIPDMPDLESPTMPENSSVIDEGIEEVEDVLDSAQLISDRLGDDDFSEDLLSPEPAMQQNYDSDNSSEISFDDLMGGVDAGLGSEEESSLTEDEDFPSGDDLLADIDSPDDLAALGFADEDETSISLSSEGSGGSLFSADEEVEDEDSIFSTESNDLDFESTLENADEEDNSDGKLPDSYKPYSYKESSGGFTKVIVIGVVVIGVIAAALLFFGGESDDSEKEVAKVEKKKVVTKKKVEEPVAKVEEEVFVDEPLQETEAPIEEENLPVVASSAEPGEIIPIQAKTGQSYIIVGSFIDEDLAMDYAKQLSEAGSGVKLIYPYGKSKRYRLSIADFSTYGDAASQLNEFKGEYGDQVWALKY